MNATGFFSARITKDNTLNDKNVTDAAELLKKIGDMVDNDEINSFTKDEAVALREVAKTWNQFKSVIILGSAIGSGMKWFVFAAATWTAFKVGIFEWIKAGVLK